MTITSFKKKHDTTGTFGAVLDSKFTEHHICETSVDYTDFVELYRLAVIGGYIPGHLQQHFSIPLFARRDVHISRVETPSTKRYLFKVPYSSKPLNQEEEEEEEAENPLDRPPDISVSTESSEIPGVKDREDKLYANAAGDPIVDPPVMLPTSRQVYTITQNLSLYDGDAAEAFQDAINEDPIKIVGRSIVKTFAAETALVRSITATEEKENQIEFAKVTIEIAHEIRGWNALKNPLNAGFHYIDAENKHKTIVMENGEEPKTQIPLDENGYPLTTYYQRGPAPALDPNWVFDPLAHPVYLEFDHFKKKDLTALSSVIIAS